MARSVPAASDSFVADRQRANATEMITTDATPHKPSNQCPRGIVPC
jgi:hypothetical protein